MSRVKRYLIAGLVAGIVYAVLGPVFVNHILDPTLAGELNALIERLSNGSAAPAEHTAESAADAGYWVVFVKHVGARLLWGFVTMAAFAWLRRRRARLLASCLAGAVAWFLFYVVVPSIMASKYGMSVTLFCVCVGYGLVETQLAALAGALTWGKPAPKGA